MKQLLTLSILLLLAGCSRASYTPKTLTSIHVVDQNEMMETISSADRLKNYEEVDFNTPQPYKKVLRVFERDGDGDVRACITTYHDNGQPERYLEIANGRAHGKYQEWYSSGQQKVEAFVVGGEADVEEGAMETWLFEGCCKAWDRGGFLEAEISYEKGLLHGTSVYYHQNGNVWRKIPYKQGLVDGTACTFQEDGDLFQQVEFAGGIEEGSAARWWSHKDNLVAFEETYKGGLLLEGQYFDQKGRSLSSIEGGEGFRACFEGDSLFALQQYQGGICEGLIKEVSREGDLLRTYYVKNEQMHGEEIEYYPPQAQNPHPQAKLSVRWCEDKMSGMAKTWYENGELESQREMNNNQKNGLSLAWYRDGSLMLSEEYEKDKLVKGEYFKKGDKIPTSKVHYGKGLATLHDSEGQPLYSVQYHNGVPLE